MLIFTAVGLEQFDIDALWHISIFIHSHKANHENALFCVNEKDKPECVLVMHME